MKKLYLLTEWSSDGGLTSRCFDSLAKVYQALLNDALDNWEHYFDGQARPTDPRELMPQYYDSSRNPLFEDYMYSVFVHELGVKAAGQQLRELAGIEVITLELDKEASSACS